MRGRHWLVLAGVAIAALAGGVLALPGLFDWNRLRPEIATLAGDALGRRVRIDGPVSLVLLPEPTLTADDVTFEPVGGESAGSGRMTAKALRVKVALGALLGGRIEARELVVRGMDLRLPWPLPPDGLAIRAPDWLSALSARIESGRVAVGDIEVADVDATLTTAAGTGTYQAAGTGVLAGRKWRFAVRLTQPGGDGSAGLNLSLDGQGPAQGLSVALSGQMGGDGNFAGRVSMRGTDLSQLMPGPASPFRAEGRLTVAAGLAAADELVGEIGGGAMRGAVALRISPALRLDVALTANRLDLDAWWTALARPRDEAAGALTIGVDISAEAAILAGGTLRGLRAALDVAGGVIELRELRAVLPGEAVLRAAGRLGSTSGKATNRFDGYIALTAPAPRTTLGWLAPGAEVGLPPGVLAAAALSAHVVAEPGVLALDGLAGTIDETTIEGAISLRLGGRPALKGALKLGRVDVLPWLERAGPNWLATLATLDADLKLEAATVVAGTIVVDAVVVDAVTEPARMSLRRFEAGIAGTRLVASGMLLDGARVADAKLALTVPAEGLRATELAWAWPAWLTQAVPPSASIWRAQASLDWQGAGAAGAVAGKGVAQIGDLVAELAPNLDLLTGKWSLGVAVRHPGVPRLLESLGLGSTAGWLGDGSLGLITHVQGQPGRLNLDGFDLALGALRADGALTLALSGEGGTIAGRLNFETLPLPLPYPRASQPFPSIALAGWDGSLQVTAGTVLLALSPALGEARGLLVLADRRARLESLVAKMAGGNLTGALAIDGAASPPTFSAILKLDGATTQGRLFDLPFDLEAERVDAMLSLTGVGHSPGALLATLAGEAHLEWRQGRLHGMALSRLTGDLPDAEVRAALAAGTTEFDTIKLDLALGRGVANLRDFRLDSTAGTITATGTIDLPAGTQSLRFELSPALQDPPRLGLRATGPWATPTRVPELSDLIRWRATR